MHDTCVNQSGCPEDIIENARNGDFNPDQRFKAFLKCCFEQEDGVRTYIFSIACCNFITAKVMITFSLMQMVIYWLTKSWNLSMTILLQNMKNQWGNATISFHTPVTPWITSTTIVIVPTKKLRRYFYENTAYFHICIINLVLFAAFWYSLSECLLAIEVIGIISWIIL